jgi:hypothetical protein
MASWWGHRGKGRGRKGVWVGELLRREWWRCRPDLRAGELHCRGSSAPPLAIAAPPPPSIAACLPPPASALSSRCCGFGEEISCAHGIQVHRRLLKTRAYNAPCPSCLPRGTGRPRRLARRCSPPSPRQAGTVLKKTIIPTGCTCPNRLMIQLNRELARLVLNRDAS